MELRFSAAARDAGTAANYELRAAGEDGLLGTADDAITALSVSYSGTTATLNFAGLPKDIYRLTVHDAITDADGNLLDGDVDGTAGGDFVTDFVAISYNDLSLNTTTYSLSSTSPFGITSGDFNGDGIVDLATANESSNGTVDILLGNGTGGFTAGGKYGSGGATPRTIAAGDFNRDGKLDLAVANYGDRTVGILLGNGNGGFTTAATCNVGVSSLQGLAISDFDGDGDLDIATTSLGYDSIGILLNNGRGSFTTQTIASGGKWPDDIACADFNHDGKMDLAVVNGFSDDVGIRLGDGCGGFAAAKNYSTGGLRSQGIAVGDFNNDGNIDVVTSSFASNTIGVLLGKGDGTFAATTTFTTGGSWPGRIAVADFSGDGVLDLAVHNQVSNNVGLLIGNGSGGFAAAVPFSSGGAAPQGIVAADFNKDGKCDLAVTNQNSNSVGVLLNTRNYDFVALTSAAGAVFDVAVGSFSAGALLQGSESAFDGDGRLIVGNKAFQPSTSTYTIADAGQTVVIGTGKVAGLTVKREITVPNTGSEGFARTIDSFTNATASTITTTVTIVGNLGSDADTVVFMTSDGDNIVETTDQWIATDDADGLGSPAVIHYIHGPLGLQPVSVSVIGDNIVWTYDLTVEAYQTVGLAYFTVTNTSQAGVVAAANALVTDAGFGGQAAAFLDNADLASLANIQFQPATTTTTAVVASASSSDYGQAVTFTATVRSDASERGEPTGNVKLLDGAIVLGVAALDVNGQAVFTTSRVNVGVRAITASYVGNASFSSSISSSLQQTVAPVALTITVNDQTIVYGAALPTFTASYTGFVNGETAASLSIRPTFTTTATAASEMGSYLVVASDAVDANYAISYVSGMLTVIQAATVTNIVASAATTTFGEAVTLTATVTAVSPSTATLDSGTVTFMDGATTLGTATLNAGAATFSTSSLQAGSHTLLAVYSADEAHFADSRTTVGSTSIITTFAGNGGGGYSGDDGPATAAQLGRPKSVAIDAAGDFYIADQDNHRIRKVDHITGVITTVVGDGTQGYSGDGGLATSAQLNQPWCVAVNAAGDLFIADRGNSCIRKVDHATGAITTVAGSGTVGYQGDGGLATAARLSGPTGVALDAAGNLFIADMGNDCIRKVDCVTGMITIIAGTGRNGGYSGDGGLATAAQLSWPNGIAVDAAGNLFIADTHNNRIRKVDHVTGVITTVAGSASFGLGGDGGLATAAALFSPHGVAVDAVGNLFIADMMDGCIRKVDYATNVITTIAGNGGNSAGADGGQATATTLNCPYGVAVDASGDVFIADTGNYSIRKIDHNTGVITTVAGGPGLLGDGGQATVASVSEPSGVAVDAAGNLFISDYLNDRIRRVDYATGVITTVAGNGTEGYGGDGGLATDAALYCPQGIALDAAGNLFIADDMNHRIRKVDHATGVITTVAGNGGCGYSGDGGLATEAELYSPHAITLDAVGNLFISDTFNHRVRKVDHATGVITTIAGIGTKGYSGDNALATAAELTYPEGLALDAVGNLFIADGSNGIRKVDLTTGIITTIAGNGQFGDTGDGGLATAAGLNDVSDCTFDAEGNLFLVTNTKVRRIDHATGIITTVAGGIDLGFKGDGGQAANAAFHYPAAVALDRAGNLFIADWANRRVRKISNGASLTVKPATLTITANSGSIVYGAALPTLTYSVAGLLGSDTLTSLPTLSTSATSASHAGSYAIVASGASVNSNYAIRYVTGTLSITPASLTITTDAQTKAYGAELPTFTANYSGFVNGDTEASLTTQPTITTDATAGSHVGTYAITASGAVDPDYVISYVARSLAVTPVGLTITADAQTKAYGVALPSLTASYSGFVNGDTEASLTTQPLLATSATDVSDVGTYAITVSDATSLDYAITYVGGTLSVTPATLTVAADNKIKVARDVMPALTYTVTGLVGSDTLSTLPTLSTKATATSPVGTYAITVAGATASTNYTVTLVGGTLAVVSPQAASVVVTASPSPSTLGQATTFTAVVSALPWMSTPTGRVTFIRDGNAMLGAVSLDASGRASLTTTALGIGDHTVTAVYKGNSIHLTASETMTQTVTQAASTTVLSTTSDSSVFGQSLTFTAQVAVPPRLGRATGAVTFTVDGVVVATVNVNSSGKAKFSTSTLGAGAHTVAASYSGCEKFTGSVAQLSHTVNKAATVTSVYAPNRVFGLPVTITAKVAVMRPGRGTPSGMVTFRDNGVLLGTAALSSGNMASLTTSALNAGIHTITATFEGNGDLAGSVGSTLR